MHGENTIILSRHEIMGGPPRDLRGILYGIAAIHMLWRRYVGGNKKRRKIMEKALILLILLTVITVKGQNRYKHSIEGKRSSCYLLEQDQRSTITMMPQ
jgi:hypothetical protein